MRTLEDSITIKGLSDFTFPSSSAEIFPDNGVGSCMIDRNVLVNKVSDILSENKVASYYFRGPRGSGKTLMLYLLGRKLQSSGCKVIFIKHSGKLTGLSDEVFQDLDSSSVGRTYAY